MKSILKKVAGLALSAALVFGMISCSSESENNAALIGILMSSKGNSGTPVMQTVATPAFSVASGAVNSGTEVTITCGTEGAKIYYTTDGTEPTAESTEYTAAISVTEAVSIKAIAVKSGMNYSAVASVSYTIKETVATPAFSVASGAVNSGTEVTITCSTEGAKIYYTTDGTEPTAESTEYTAAISITDAVSIKAIAVKSGMNYSAVASVSYTIKETVATPAFSVASGAVDSGTSVTITCSTEGAKIYYTTDGTEPTAESTEYTAAISITDAGTLKAIAVKDGMNNSAVASASYNIPVVFVKGGTVVGKKNTNNYSGVFIEGRTVTLSDFYMSKYEVTQDEYSSVMTGQKVTVSGTEYTLNANPSYCTEGNSYFGTEQGKRPVEGVTWYDAVYYCNAKSKKEGLTAAYDITVTKVSSNGNITAATVTLVDGADGYRLPTEAEWEYAARGGDPSAADWDYTFSGADTAAETSYSSSKNSGLDTVGWYCYNNDTGTTGSSDVTSNASGKGTHQVGQKAPNALGIYDMSGNVLEWCYDWYNSSVSTGEETDPFGSSSGSNRVFRGGSWSYYDARFASVCFRCSIPPSSGDGLMGFRLVRSAN